MFRALSILAPSLAANLAFSLFQKTRNKIRTKEESFLNSARHFQVTGKNESIDCYELGNPKGKLVLLVHGWNSNAGSMAAVADKLSSLGYRVVAFNLPAHGTSKLKKANLIDCSHAMLNVLGFLNPTEKFSIVTHSFGSAVATFTLSKVSYPLDKIMFLTTPNRLIDIFEQFRTMIGLGNEAFKIFLQSAETLLGEHPDEVNINEKMKQVTYNEFILLHDLFDRIIPHSNSLKVHNSNPGSRLITTVGVGHYKMLWDEKVLDQVEDLFLAEERVLRRTG